MDGFDHILNWKLQLGSHPFPGKEGGTCINEAAIVAAGFAYQPVRKSAFAIWAQIWAQTEKVADGFGPSGPLGLDLPSALHTSSSTFSTLLNVTFIGERLSERDHLEALPHNR